MPKFANFVQCTLVSAITIGATSIEVEAQAPFNLPPDPAGEKAYLTLMDSVNNPTAFEIISYTGINSTGPTTLELTGVTRAEQGTAAQAWDAGAMVRQDVTASNIGLFDNVLNIRVIAGSKDTTVRGFSLDIGAETWSNNESADDVFAVASLSNSFYSVDKSGIVRRIDQFGQTVWQKQSRVPNSAVGLVASPAGRVYYAHDDLSIGQQVIAFDAETGSELWAHDMNNSVNPPNIGTDVDGNVFLILGSSALRRIYPDGSLAFSKTLSGSNAGIAVAPERFLYIGELFGPLKKFDYDGNEIASTGVIFGGAGPNLSAFEGGVVWTTPQAEMRDSDLNQIWNVGTVGSGEYPPAVDSSRNVYYVRPGLSRSIKKLDGLTGDELWETLQFGAEVTSVSMSPSATVFSDGFEMVRRSVRWDDVAGKPESISEQIFSERGTPATPPTGKAIIFVDSVDGAFKVKFDNGVVKTIATP